MPLFDLIKAMDTAEKRHFKLYAKDKSLKYVELFDLINKQSKPNDEAIIKAGFTSGDKNFLYEKVDESIHALRLGKKGIKYSDNRIKWLLERMKRLFEHGLWTDLQKCINTTKKLAEKHEQFLDWLQAIQWEKELLTKSKNSKEFYERYEILVKEEADVQQKLNEQINYRNLRVQINMLRIKDMRFQKDETREKLDCFANSEWLQLDEQPYSLETQVDFYYSKSMIALYQKQKGRAYIYAKKAVETFEKNESFGDKAGYKRSLGLLAEVCSFSDRKHEIPEIIEKIEVVLSESDYEVQSAYHHGLLYALTTADKEKGLKYIELIDKILVKHGDKIRGGRHLTFFYNISVFYCLFNQWQEAAKWLNKIFHFKRTDDRKDIQLGARLLRFIIAYECEGELENHIRSVSAYLENHKGDTDINKYVIDSFNSLNNTANYKDEILIWGNLEHYLTPHIQATPLANLQLGLGELQIWCKAKINNTTMAEIVRETIPTPA